VRMAIKLTILEDDKPCTGSSFPNMFRNLRKALG